MTKPSGVAAVVVAGGRGERMGAAAQDVPKPMLPLGGKPLLEHLLAWLKRSGFSEIHLCLGHKAETVVSYFGDGKDFGLGVRYHLEKEPRGTAGCVKDAAAVIPGPGDLLVVYGDLFVDMDCARFLDFHQTRKAAATLAIVSTDHPYDSDLVKIEGERVAGFYRAKPGEPCENWAAGALWLIKRSLLDLVPEAGLSDFGRNIFPAALSRGDVLAAYKTAETLADLGTPERWEKFAARPGGAGAKTT
ncbi:MAG TPA: nucleotidyltransferase family protein [Elusimicrobiota bacterium]|nr:nucleotidyltransferase family protein [Elusimicrobiota bacterium]